MTLIRKVVSTYRLLHLLHCAENLIHAQNVLIEQQQRDNHRLRLDALKQQQGLVAGWLINLERPEIDLRDDLAELDREISDGIARLEEHVV